MIVGVGILTTTHLWRWGFSNITPTIDLEELEWTFSAAIGVVLSGHFVLDNLIDWPVAESIQVRRMVEILAIVGVILLGLHMMLLSFGLLAMMTPTNPNPTNPALVQVSGVAFTVMGETLVLALLAVRSKWIESRSVPREVNLGEVC